MNPPIIALLLSSLALYLWRVQAYNARRVRPLSLWHIAAFAAMIASLFLALEPPLEPLSDTSFFFHMAQHMILIYVAAPLLLLSAPVMLFIGSVDTARARTIGRLLTSPVWRFVTFPVFTWLFFSTVLWGTHFSPLYQLALEYPLLHVLEHALYFGAAILFWQAIIHIGPVSWPMNFPLRIVYLLAAIPQSAFLGLALYESKFVLYPHYLLTQGSVTRALADQHSGGALMWVGGGLLIFTVFMSVAAMWARHEERLGTQLDAQFDARSRSVTFLGALCALILLTNAHARAARLQSAGARLYAERCSSCHGTNLEGSVNGPFLGNVSRNALEFYLTTGRMPASVPGVQNINRTPLLSPKQISAIAVYVMSRSSGNTQLVHVDTIGDVPRGRALFIANCSACHGATAKGGSVGYGMLAPNLGPATAAQIGEAIRIGPGVMPKFDSHTLSNQELNDIIRYVTILQTHPRQAGGIAFGNIGAVAEGMIAWILGLGLIVIVCRIIGTNA